ncbi:MAG: Lrp/AsnC family transcriptional regulator [Euryarchaeota archaeon]|nr:Lrp/AsnC family transcriptional regulator [Euryarchaeota archaeon]
MVKGICLIRVRVGGEAAVREKLPEIEGVREAMQLFGEYDFIAILEAESLRELNLAVDRIRSIPEVASTKTLVAAEY